ncbi:Sorting nexin lst-4 [Halotydeus destructor]|nr:Sorting nexin lst-4 [Halotydeus destructor]
MSWDQPIKVRALYDFQSQPGSGEISLVTGETLTVTRQDVGEGWWEGSNERGETGLFPEGYVEAISDSTPVSAPPSTVTQATSQPSQAGYDASADGDWGDDDWDSGSQASTTAGDNYQQQSLSGSQSYTHSAGGAAKSAAVKRSYNRFSTFVKSGGEDYILGTKNKSPPSECLVYITELEPGKISWAPSSNPYECVLASPKKESKLKGLKSYISYSLTPSFNSIQVSRRFKHFDWLHGRLEEKYITIPIPPLPDKQIAGRYQDDFIRHRLRQLQLWVDRICCHPVLSQSDVWMHFMSCTDEKRWKQGKRRAEKDDFTGASFFFCIQPPTDPLTVATIEKRTDNFARFVVKMDDAVKHLFGTSQDQCKKFMGPYRREFTRISSAFGMLSDAFSSSGSRNDAQLNEAIKHTSATYDAIGKLYEEQPRYDFEPFSDSLYEYKGLLANWPDILQVHKGALTKKKEHLKIEGPTSSSSVSQRADVVSYALLAEVDYFQEERVKDFKVMMQTFIKGQIEFYEKVVVELRNNLDKYNY